MSYIDQIISWEHWTYIAWGLYSIYWGYHLILTFIVKIKTHRYVKAVKDHPTPYEFMFGASSLLLVTVLGILTILVGYMLKLSLLGFLLAILLGLFLGYTLLIHIEIYQFEGDRIVRVGEGELPIHAKEITGITIDSSEVNFHSTKFLNHRTFKAKKLMNKEWSAFTDAIEQFAERNNIPVENS